MHIDKGSFVFWRCFRLYLGASSCIYFFWLLMYLFFMGCICKGETLCFFYLFYCFLSCATLIIDLYYEVIHNICLLFSVL